MNLQSQSKRIISLDAFRGFVIASMVLVNTPGTYGAIYPQLRHAAWNGWTFTDCIFPSFLFIVGVSLVFSLGCLKKDGRSLAQIEYKVGKRAVILFGLGLFLNSFPIFHLSTLRIPGVLQRIAVCYLVASYIALKNGWRGQALWLIVLLAGYWLMMQFIPVPEIGPGVFEPGRNFAAYIDSLILDGHMWSVYETWDPEGIISSLPAISTTLFGTLTGMWLQSDYSRRTKAAAMLLTGMLLVLLGEFTGIWLPINKNLWTSSFSIFMAGLSLSCLSVFYWIMDVKNHGRWAQPFTIMGMNSIAIYVLSEIIDTLWRFTWLDRLGGQEINLREFIFINYFSPIAAPADASLLYALWYVLLMLLIAWIMWKKCWFLKI